MKTNFQNIPNAKGTHLGPSLHRKPNCSIPAMLFEMSACSPCMGSGKSPLPLTVLTQIKTVQQ